MKWTWMFVIVAIMFGSADLAGGVAPVRAVLYDDTASPNPSAWAAGLEGIERVLKAAGIETRRLTRDQLNTAGLGVADVIVVGGGYAYPGYTKEISAAGKLAMRRAIESGTGYVGVCAGAWFACERIVYEGQTYGRESGYDLALYPSAGYGPVPGLPAYPSYGLAGIKFLDRADMGVAAGGGHLWYGGGPFFKQLPSGVRAVAEYEKGGVAVAAFELGKGRVVLWGAHAEFPGYGVEADSTARFVATVRWAAKRP